MLWHVLTHRRLAAAAAGAMAPAWWSMQQQPAQGQSVGRSEPLTSGKKSTEAGVELLVHNISHSDMVLTLQEALPGQPLPKDAAPNILARPQFNSFNPISQHILGQLERSDEKVQGRDSP